MKWQKLEEVVREIASLLFKCPAAAELVNGVKCDCVLKPSPDYWVLVEMTKDETLTKLRADLAKFASMRPALMSQNIFARCFFITEEEPPPSLIESGKGHYVDVMSVNAFRERFFDYKQYSHVRMERPFGSAINPFTGQVDDRKYIPVHYDSRAGKDVYDIPRIIKLLKQRKRIILLGTYGSGKSRCLREIFAQLQAPENLTELTPFSVNLREQWGVKRAPELIRRHFDDLGLSSLADSAVQLIGKSSLCVLLDGFDEMGAQTWSEDPTKLKGIRAKSVEGIRDFLQTSPGPAVVAGREQYFNSDEEMLTAFGLREEEALILRCPEEFNASQMKAYLAQLNVHVDVPKWIPKRPLICQVLSLLDVKVITEILEQEVGELQFWDTFVDAICVREAIAVPTLDPSTIKAVLQRIARMTRFKASDAGPISLQELNDCFKEIVGSSPTDESAQMLQRLPVLSRVGPQSADRQFADQYVLDGARADDLTSSVAEFDQVMADQPWRNSLKSFGLRLVAREASINPQLYTITLHGAIEKRNDVLKGELFASLCLSGMTVIDLKGATIGAAVISYLSLADVNLLNANIDTCLIGELDVTNAVVNQVQIQRCDIGMVLGITAERGLPEWLKDNQIARFESTATVKRIRAANLTGPQRVFVTIIKKTFFQRGRGREEIALLRGLGEAADKRASKHILSALLKEGIIYVTNGKDGPVYHPVRSHTRRMSEIVQKLTLSEDPLWKSLEDLR